MLKGRAFDRADRAGEPVAIVTSECEQVLMEGEAIGRRFTYSGRLHRIVVAGVLGVAAVGAMLVPALRASRIDPLLAMRQS